MREAVDDFGQTIVMVTHDPIAAGYADRVVFLADGKIVDELLDPTADQRARPDEEPRRARHAPCGGSRSRGSSRRSSASSSRRSRSCSASRSCRARSCSPTRSAACSTSLFTESRRGHRRGRPRQAGARQRPQGGSRRATRCPPSLLPVVRGRRRGEARRRHGARASRPSSARDGDTVQNGRRAHVRVLVAVARRSAERLRHRRRGRQPAAADEVVHRQDRRASDVGLPRSATRSRSSSSQASRDDVPRSSASSSSASSGSLAGATLAAFTPATAQRVLGTPASATRSTSQAEAGRLAGAAGRRRPHRARGRRPTARTYEVLTGEEVADEQPSDVKDRLGFFNTFLLVFAFVALFVGSFIIYNTFSIIVAQRVTRARAAARARRVGQAGHALGRGRGVRSSGCSRRCVGLVLGVFVAIGLQALLAAFGFELPSEAPRDPRRARSSWPSSLGTVVTFVSAHRAGAPRRARAAGRRDARHARSIARAAASPVPHRRRCSRSSGSCCSGSACSATSSSDDVPGGTAGWSGSRRSLVFIGVAMLEPADRAPGVAVSSAGSRRRSAGMSGVLARENAMRNPRRTATTASALMIGLALVDAGVDHRRVGEAVVHADHRRLRAGRLPRAGRRASSTGASRPTIAESARRRAARARRSCSSARATSSSSTATSEQLLGVSTERRGRDRPPAAPDRRPRRVRRRRRARVQGHRERQRLEGRRHDRRCSSSRPACSR